MATLPPPDHTPHECSMLHAGTGLESTARAVTLPVGCEPGGRRFILEGFDMRIRSDDDAQESTERRHKRLEKVAGP